MSARRRRLAPAEAREGADPVRGTPEQWAGLLARLATEQPFRGFVFWPEEPTPEQIGRFAREVAPRARAQLEPATRAG